MAPRLFRFFVLVALGFLLLAALGALGLYYYYSRDLPDIEKLADFNPPQLVRVLALDDTGLGEFGEHRQLPRFDELPPLLLSAFVAAEDASFYEHEGLDFVGILRAMVENAISLRIKQGASTITQQVVKNLLLTQKRSVERKAQEAILAWRIEQRFSKAEILYFYVNAIEYGNRALGVAEAARLYFNKPLKELSISEMAYLAGVVNGPARFALNRHPEAAKARRDYVLRRMADLDAISKEDYAKALKTPLLYTPPPIGQRAPYVVDEVRRQLANYLPPERRAVGGLVVTTTIDPALQDLAHVVVRENLLAYERRHGYRPLPVLDGAQLARFKAATQDSKTARGLRVLAAEEPPQDEEEAKAKLAAPPPVDDDEAAAQPAKAGKPLSADFWLQGLELLKPGLLFYGSVEAVTAEGALLVNCGAVMGRVEAADSAWAISGGKNAKARQDKLKALFPAGRLVVLRLTEGASLSSRPLTLSLEQTPEAQTAFVAIEPAGHSVRALVGGFSYAASVYNRATQAQRQPGSTFKPFIYLAALRTHRFTPATIIVDEPLELPQHGGKRWNPKNYDGEFRGPLRLREAMANSINIPAIKVLKAIGTADVIGLASLLGITGKLEPDLTLALGSSSVRLIELTNAYATFAALGQYATPTLIAKITDSSGAVLYEARGETKPVIAPEEAELITSLLHSVVEHGTATKARELGRPAAGKTGTTNSQRDAWFVGFVPQLAAGLWVGYDDRRPLGRGEVGGRAALGGWIAFMKGALGKEAPILPFPSSPKLIHTTIDTESGLLAEADAPGAIEEVFLPGTVPGAPNEEEAGTDGDED